MLDDAVCCRAASLHILRSCKENATGTDAATISSHFIESIFVSVSSCDTTRALSEELVWCKNC